MAGGKCGVERGVTINAQKAHLDKGEREMVGRGWGNLALIWTDAY